MQALAVDKNGVVYAATNPDGKVYRIEHARGEGKSGSGEGKISWRISPPRYISIRARNTSGTWLSMTPAICTSPPAIMAKFIA